MKMLKKKSEKVKKNMENGRFGSGFFSCDPEINPLTSSNQWLQQDVAALSRIKQRGHFLCNIPGRVIIVGHGP